MATPESRSDHPDDPRFAMTVEDVCRLAWDYTALGTASARDLIERSGYPGHWQSITAERLAITLRDHPDWVDAWIQWSEDKRGGSRWYLVKCGESAFDVGSWPPVPPVRYSDGVAACAVFVRHELASIADVGPLAE